MEPESSLPCSQEPSTSPYFESDHSSQYHSILFSKFLFILSSHLCVGLPNGLFHSHFPTKILYTFLFGPMRATYPTYVIRFDLLILIILGEEYRL
jgi:hypothetical protein